tara:strand:- start:1454 stop:2137 length:684 start_codon:yes stop_codon:yes gene_type:complete
VTLLTAVRAALGAAAVPEDAEPMRAYMKSALPFWGVKKKARQAALTPVFAAHPVAGRAALEREVRALWFGATHREERYAALDLMRRREHRGLWTPAALPLLEELVVTGAWWDLVDELATKLVRATLGNAPESAETLRRWSRGDDLWLRRAAILAQIGLEDTTDRALLAELIEPAIPSSEFFLRKAIGWALRDLSKVDPDWVRAFVDGHSGLSGLSRREALKHLGPRS